MVVNSVVGFSQIDGEMLDLAKTMGMKPWTEFRKIRLPNSVLIFLPASKLPLLWRHRCRSRGVRIRPTRVGYLIIIGNNELNAALIFASITVLSVMSLGLFGVIVGLEKVLMPWRRGIYPTSFERRAVNRNENVTKGGQS